MRVLDLLKNDSSSNIIPLGYGDVACQTTVGRMMTVVYAIVGIPLMLITLNDLGKFLYKAINELINLLRMHFGRVRTLIRGKQTQIPQNGALSAESAVEHTKKVEFQLSINGKCAILR